MEKNFIEFGEFFDPVKKEKKNDTFPDFNDIKNNKMTPNFDAFNLFLHLGQHSIESINAVKIKHLKIILFL